MLRFVAGVISTLLLVGAGFFVWKSRANQEVLVPPAPPASEAPALNSPLRRLEPEPPPAATAKSKEEKRFARADKDDDGRITKLELLEPRRKAFAKLDRNGNGSLSFEEWAVRTATKFEEADKNQDGVLLAAEYATTAPKPRAKPKCSC
jgi:hypothetical protein